MLYTSAKREEYSTVQYSTVGASLHEIIDFAAIKGCEGHWSNLVGVGERVDVDQGPPGADQTMRPREAEFRLSRHRGVCMKLRAGARPDWTCRDLFSVQYLE